MQSHYSKKLQKENIGGLTPFPAVVGEGGLDFSPSSLSECADGTASALQIARAILREQNPRATLDDVLGSADSASEGWRRIGAREILTDAWAEWVSSLCDWKSFITLTFERERFPDVAKSLFRWWVKVNNQYVFGKRYTRKVGHSYFSYLCGMEYQKREVVHFHVLVDKPIHYSVTHNAWGDRCGFAWIDGKLKDKQSVIDYVCKYVTKGGEIDIYQAKKDYAPAPMPTWWRDAIKEDSEVIAVKGWTDPAASAGPVQLAQPLTACGNGLKLVSELPFIM